MRKYLFAAVGAFAIWCAGSRHAYAQSRKMMGF